MWRLFDPQERPSRVRSLRASIARIEGELLLAFAAAATLLLAFAMIAARVAGGEPRAFDRRILLALRSPTDPSDPIGPRWFQEMVRDFTALGSTGVLTLVVLVVAGFLVMTRRHYAALVVLAASIGGTLVSHFTKLGFARPRPDLVPHEVHVYTPSFPSGHAMMSAVVYLTLGALLARTQASRRAKAYILGVAVALTLLVGMSRVYLGVHWPTDVLAGWSLGAGWAILCWLVMLALQRRGDVEPEHEQAADPDSS